MSCCKTSYETKELALIKINEISKKEKGNHNRIPIRAYRCEKCNLFHLTSFTRSKQKEVKLKQEYFNSVEFKYRDEIKSLNQKENKPKLLKFKNKD